jgi:ABC-2 type transport system permease protein
MAAMIFILPIVQLMVFGFALTNEVKNISFYAQYPKDDLLAAQIEQRILASKWFVKGDKNSAQVSIIFPQERGGLARAIERKNFSIGLFIDATNAQRATQIENYVKSIIAQGLQEEYKNLAQSVLNVNVKILYNPSLKSAYFMVPALMGFILCILTVLITAMSLSKEKEFGTFEKLICSPATIWEILLGKTVPYCLIAFIVVPLIVFASIFIFEIPVRGGILQLLIVCLIFIVSSCSVAVFISTLAKTQQQAMMGSLMFLFPALFLSGLIFPIENMPIYVRWLANLNPLYYLLALLRNIMLKGTDFIFLIKNCGALIIIGSVLAIFSARKFNSKLN